MRRVISIAAAGIETKGSKTAANGYADTAGQSMDDRESIPLFRSDFIDRQQKLEHFSYAPRGQRTADFTRRRVKQSKQKSL